MHLRLSTTLTSKIIWGVIMRKVGIFFICLILVLSISLPCSAEESIPSNTQVINLDNGLMAEEVTTVYANARSSEITAERNWSVKDGSTVIANITVKGTFRYNGTSVSVVSKELTECDTYDGWSFSSTSLTSSGGTITFSGTLKKSLLIRTNITLTLSCDKDGNIS